MAKVTSSLAKSLGPNQSNVLGLVHSALDLSQELYDFSLWIGQEKFTQAPRIKTSDVVID